MTSLPRFSALAGALAALVALGGCATEPDLPFDCQKCDHLEDGPSDDLGDRWRGQDKFESAAPYWDVFPFRTLSEAATRDGGQPERSVEDSDVVSLDEDAGLLYVLNSYRGLQVLDVADADNPRLVGRAPLAGYPIEMFRQGGHAFVLLNSLESERADAYRGAVLRVFDITDPSSPIETAEFKVPGYITGSRLLRVADGSSSVIYIASQVYTWMNDDVFGGQSSQRTFVMSVDVTDPQLPVEVDSVDFEGSGWQTHVTPDAMFVAQHDWSSDLTTIQYVDISDFGGDIRVRGVTSIEGRLSWGDRGELQMDYHQGHLRVASQVRGTIDNPSRIRISTIDASNPTQLAQVGELDVGEGHRLLSARFSGDKAYLFHMVQVDPLEVIDLSVPAAPKSLGILKIDGWVNHIEVRGDKLLTIGVDSATERKLALIMFDVSNPTAPIELSRATAGEGWAWTSATHDIKSFSIIDGEAGQPGLVLLPVSSSSTDETGRWRYRRFMQVFTFDDYAGTVTARGEIDNIGIRRSLPVQGRVVTFSDQQLQTIDLANPDAPVVTATLELARNVVDFTTVGAFGLMVVGKGDWSEQTTELRVVSLHDPDNSSPLATLPLATPPGQLFKIDAGTVVNVGSDPITGEGVVTVLDFSDPLAPSVLGSLGVAELGFSRFGRFVSWRSAPTQQLARVGEALAAYTFAKDGEAPGGKLRVINIENRAFPHVSAVVDLGEATLVDMKAEGTKLYVSSYVSVESAVPGDDTGDDVVGSNDDGSANASAASLLPGAPMFPFPNRSRRAAYQLHIVDLADPTKPTVSSPISVPGKYIGQSQFGEGEFAVTVLYTSDKIPQGDAGSAEGIDTMMLVGRDKVRLLDIFGVGAGAENVTIDGDKAYFTTAGWWSGPFFLESNGGSSDIRPAAKLSALDLSRPDTIELASATEIEGASFATLGKVAGGRAFISTGYGTLEVYDLRGDAATKLGSFTTIGWWSGKVTALPDGRAYLPAGMYGLHVIDAQ